MLFGMGTVFVFLTVLVFATTLMSKVVNQLAPEEVQEADGALPNDTALQSAHSNINPRTLEAIKLAIKAHRSK